MDIAMATTHRMSDPRYRTRLRGKGFRDDEPLDLVGLFLGDDLGVWDTLEKRWVKRSTSGEWVPE